MTPEGKVKKLVQAELKRFDAYYHMPVQSGMGAPTLDFICCYRGLYFAIETKAPGKKLTPRQEITMKAIQDRAGVVFKIDGPESLGVLTRWLELQHMLKSISVN